MRVFKIGFELVRFQSFLLEDTTLHGSEALKFDGRFKRETWTPPKVYVLHPMLQEPDFWHLNSGSSLIASPEAFKKVRKFFTSAGECLPLPYRNREFALLNVTECIDCLDHERCDWVVTKSGQRMYPKRSVFRPDRFTSSIFKIPETAVGYNLTVEWEGDPEREFKAAYEHNDMKGLKFDLLWEGH